MYKSFVFSLGFIVIHCYLIIMNIFCSRVRIDFSDTIGNVWNDGEEVDKLVMTAGVEGKLALGPIVLALGQAQTIDGWEDGGKPDSYFRLALINPF